MSAALLISPFFARLAASYLKSGNGSSSGQWPMYFSGCLYGPVEDIVVLKTLANEEITEDHSEVDVIWLGIEAEGTSIIEVNGKLVGQTMAKDFGTGGHFLKHDAVIPLLRGSSLETLPWKGATAEVQHNVSKGLQIITSRLLCEDISI